MPLLFPFRPTWRSTVLERLEWLTDVLTARTGAEQRRQLRIRPRRTLEYEAVVHTSALSRLDALLWAAQSAGNLLPIWTDGQRLTAPLPAGADAVPCRTAGMDFEPGQRAVLMRGSDVHEVVEVADVTPTGLELATPTAQDWPARTHLYPVRPARLPDDCQIQRASAAAATLTLRWDVDPSPWPASDDGPLYRGLPVALRRPNWSRGIATRHQRTTERIDSGTGPVFAHDIPGLPAVLPAHRYALASRAEIAAYRAWLYARAGRCKPCWMPQWSLDLQQTAPASVSSTTLRVRRIDAGLYGLADGRRDIALRRRAGQWVFRRVTAVTADGADDVLTLDTALGFDAPLGEIRMATWLVLSRLDIDSVELAWRSSAVAESEIITRSIPQ